MDTGRLDRGLILKLLERRFETRIRFVLTIGVAVENGRSRRFTRGRGNNSGPVLDAIGDDLTRIVPLFARWIYEDRGPATGTPVAAPAKRRNSHYAITIFTGASFYN